MADLPSNAAEILREVGPVNLEHHFGALDEFTQGMHHPERVAWLAEQIGCVSDDERQEAENRETAWVIVAAWEAENARLDAYARASVERQWEQV